MGRLFRTRAAALAVAILAGALTAPAAQQPDDPGEPRTEAALTILQLNDVYSTVPVDGAGGLARVATLKQRLTRDGVAPLMLMAGDFLSSSVASTIFKGEQMIAVACGGNFQLNYPLGDAVVVFGMPKAVAAAK